MKLSTIACGEITGNVTGSWISELQGSPLLCLCLQGFQQVWFRDGLFHWKDFLTPNDVCKGNLQAFLQAVSRFESGTHPELTRVGPAPRPNQLNVVVFVHMAGSIMLQMLLSNAQVAMEDYVIAPHATLKLTQKEKAAA